MSTEKMTAEEALREAIETTGFYRYHFDGIVESTE